MVGDTSWWTFCFACFLRLYVMSLAKQKNKQNPTFTQSTAGNQRSGRDEGK